MKQMLSRPHTLLALICPLLVLVSCSGGSPAIEAPPQVMLDREARFSTRMNEARTIWQSVDSGEVSHANARKMLKSLAWQRASSSTLRVEAIRQLLLDEAGLDDTRSMMGYMLPTESRMGQLGVLEEIRDAAIEHGWADLKGPFVRSLSFDVSTIDDEDRPEFQALAALSSDGDATGSVFDVFAGERSPYSIAEKPEQFLSERLQAWTLLTRLDPTGERILELVNNREIVQGLDEDVRNLLEDARASVSIYRTVPHSAEQLAWVGRLRRGNSTELWTHGQAMLAELPIEKREGVRLRHVAALLWAKEHASGVFEMSREGLFDQLDVRLTSTRKYSRERGPSAADQKRSILYDWREELSWADLVAIAVALEFRESLAIASPVFSQADRDHTDRSTEYGGVIFAQGGLFEPRLYTPRPSQRFGDGRFVASSDMIQQSDDALFHYHFQAQRHKNSEYAGPSKGDIEYAERYGRACLVFTFINADTLNVDYYQPGGARIDLGAIRRPGS